MKLFVSLFKESTDKQITSIECSTDKQITSIKELVVSSKESTDKQINSMKEPLRIGKHSNKIQTQNPNQTSNETNMQFPKSLKRKLVDSGVEKITE